MKVGMKQQISIEEVRKLEQNARRLRSETIFDTLASPFKGIGWTISRVVASLRKTYNQVESAALGARAR